MKKTVILIVTFCMIFSTLGVGFASKGNYFTYEVVAVTENSITLERKNRQTVLNRKPKGLIVGDKVRYNKRKHILKRNIEQNRIERPR